MAMTTQEITGSAHLQASENAARGQRPHRLCGAQIDVAFPKEYASCFMTLYHLFLYMNLVEIIYYIYVYIHTFVHTSMVPDL